MVSIIGSLRSPVRFDARFAYLEKQSQALRGRNLMRDIQVDGAPTVHPAPGSPSRQGPLFWHLRTPERMPQKILGAWGQRPLRSPCSTLPPSRLAPRARFPARPSAALVSLGILEPVTFTRRFQDMAAMG